jgi:hypothetical protein
MRTISLLIWLSGPQVDARTLCQQQAQASASAPEASDTQKYFDQCMTINALLKHLVLSCGREAMPSCGCVDMSTCGQRGVHENNCDHQSKGRGRKDHTFRASGHGRRRTGLARRGSCAGHAVPTCSFHPWRDRRSDGPGVRAGREGRGRNRKPLHVAMRDCGHAHTWTCPKGRMR